MMHFKHLPIPIAKTSYLKQITIDFLDDPLPLRDFYAHHVKHEDYWQSQIQNEEKLVDRERLYSVLTEQYQKAGINLKEQGNEKVLENLQALKSEDTYTITTGQQIHIFLGPVFVWYKIYSLIAQTRAAIKALKNKHVVPVFWMATEDHDFDEISEVNLYNETYKWETDQTGAVGRMNPKSLSELADQILERIDDTPVNREFITLCKQAYLQSDTLAEATRKIIHESFKSFGLLVIDPDEEAFKQAFEKVAKWDLTENGSQSLVEKTNAQLMALGYTPQINGRTINLFWLKDQSRKRIDHIQGKYALVQDQSADEDFDPDHAPYSGYSPNALLRPLYQELILPNIAYVAGGSEIAYWLQLKPIFDHWKITFPLLLLRSHGMIIHEKLLKKLTKKAPIETYFLQDKAFRQHLLKERSEEQKMIENLLEKAESQLGELKEKLEQSSFAPHLSWKDFSASFAETSKLKHHIEHAFEEYFENNEEIKPAMSQKERYFDREIQERKRSGLNYLKELELLKDSFKSEEFESIWLRQEFLNIFISK